MKTRLKGQTIHKTQIAALFLLPVLLAACKGQSGAGMGNMGPQEYSVATLKPVPAELKRAFPATIKGKQDVEIRPNVSGFITKLCVDEGATVRKGQTLFIIDQVPYKAALEVAEANVNVAKAAVATAKLTAENKRELQKRNIISEYELQMAENTLISQKAALAQAEAQLVNARNNLSYTEVKSPSNGVIGTIPYKLGALVSPSITVPMTTVSDIDEVYVYFSMNEKQLLELIREDASVADAVKKMPEIELQLADNSIYTEKGRVEMISGVIDQGTGAVSMRAAFPNTKHLLRSGGTGSVLIPYVFESSLQVPQNATYEIQDKKFVYKLDSGSVVTSTQIEIFPIDNGQNYIVTSGLNEGDQIVTEGVARLRNGMTIKPVDETQKATVEAAAQAAPQAQEVKAE